MSFGHQNQPRVRTTRDAELAGLAAFLLTGCASNSYWQSDPAWSGFKPTEILVVEKDDPSPFCRTALQSVLGCAIRQREANQCTVFLKSRLSQGAHNCTLAHEMRHCYGDHHNAFNDRPHYAIDCGNGEVYGAPASRPVIGASEPAATMPVTATRYQAGRVINLCETSITFGTLTVIALSGCASPHGTQEPAWTGDKLTHIAVVEKDNLSSFCVDNRATLGCVVRLRKTNQCIVFVKSGLSHEAHGRVITSETKRCFGNQLDI